MSHFTKYLEDGLGVVITDFDDKNPNCKKDPNVRIGCVDHYPLTDEEYAQFVAKTEPIGKASEVFPNGYNDDNIIEVWCKYYTLDAMLWLCGVMKNKGL